MLKLQPDAIIQENESLHAENERLRLAIAAASQWIACHGEHGGGPEGVLAIRQVLDNFTVEQSVEEKP